MTALRRRAVQALARRWPLVRRALPDRPVLLPVRGGWLYANPRNSPMSLQRVARVYEPGKFANLRRLLPPGGVFVDVGAHTGDFVLWAARCGGPATRVLALEADPANAELLRRGVERNRIGHQVTVVQVAVSDHQGEVELLLTPMHGTHSIVENQLHHEVDAFKPVGRVPVPCQTLDALLAEHGVDRVDVLKVDVEGAEELVLAGAARLLGGSQPLVLLLDLHFGVDVPGLVRGLQAQGFTVRTEDDPDVVVEALPPKTLSLVALRT